MSDITADEIKAINDARGLQNRGTTLLCTSFFYICSALRGAHPLQQQGLCHDSVLSRWSFNNNFRHFFFAAAHAPQYWEVSVDHLEQVCPLSALFFLSIPRSSSSSWTSCHTCSIFRSYAQTAGTASVRV
jgi:hypothetical protein